MKTKITAMVLLLFLGAGCKQEMNDVTKPQMNPSAAKESIKPDAGFQNPYNFMGEAHNKMLEAGYKYINDGGDASVAGGRAFFIRYYKEQEGRDVTAQYEKTRNRMASLKDPMSVMEDSKYTEKSKALFRSMNRIMESLNKPDVDFEKQMLQIEQQAVNSSLPDDEVNGILKVSAIAKYSGLLWLEKKKEAANNPDGKNIFDRIMKAIVPPVMDFKGALVSMFNGESVRDIIAAASEESFWASFWLSN